MHKAPEIVHPRQIATGWYLTVRCTNFRCQGLIAFQKSEFPGDNPNVRVKITGTPSVNCPYCDALVRFGADQIEHKHVVVTGRVLQ